MTVEEMLQGTDHFIGLARRGKPNTGASGGELRARKLAIAILNNVAGLDDEAIEGAAKFLVAASIAPSAISDLIQPTRAEMQ